MSRSTPQDHIGGRSELGAASPASYAVCQNSMPCDALMRVKRAAIRGYTYVQGTHAGFGSRTNAMKFTMQADATIIPQDSYVARRQVTACVIAVRYGSEFTRACVMEYEAA